MGGVNLSNRGSFPRIPASSRSRIGLRQRRFHRLHTDLQILGDGPEFRGPLQDGVDGRQRSSMRSFKARISAVISDSGTALMDRT